MSAPATPSGLPQPALRARRTLLLILLVVLAGCESIGYYAHLAGGQLKLLTERKSVDRVLRDLDVLEAPTPETARLKARLELSQALLAYARITLSLPVGGRYRSYVELDRDAVVWNLFAAPPLSLEPHLWCHPFVGCVPYRGYFDVDRAQRDRARMEAQGMETYLGPVAAYSTLGWFDDPLLSTFVALDEADFVELVLHELAHSRVWVRGDATFNESFASFVGHQGAREWFVSHNRQDVFEARAEAKSDQRAAGRILEQTRDALALIYGSGRSEVGMRRAKTEVLAAAGRCLDRLAERTGNEGYRRLRDRLNNAYLASLATYTDAVPTFAALFEAAHGEWDVFYERVDALAALDEVERAEALSRSGEHQVAADGDDDGADQVECEALLRHGLDGEAAGAEHDDVGGGGHG